MRMSQSVMDDHHERETGAGKESGKSVKVVEKWRNGEEK